MAISECPQYTPGRQSKELKFAGLDDREVAGIGLPQHLRVRHQSWQFDTVRPDDAFAQVLGDVDAVAKLGADSMSSAPHPMRSGGMRKKRRKSW
jgi:hypothetical protein